MDKRLVLALIACFASGLCFVIVPSAIADKPPAPPGQGECDKGNSTNQCTTDPSTNGKDCETHGNNGGINEGHCLTTSNETTTTTPSTSSTTTTRETTSTTTTTETTPSTSSTSSTTTTPNQTTSVLTQTTQGTTSTPTATSPQTTSVPAPTEPTPDPAPPLKKKHSKVTITAVSLAASNGELPYTGLKLIIVVLVGVALVVSGLYLRRKKNAA